MQIVFRYSKEYPNYSEHCVLPLLNRVSPTLPGCYSITTSTITAFEIVRCWCERNKVELIAFHEHIEVTTDRMVELLTVAGGYLY